MGYANVTLTAHNSDLSVFLYLPMGLQKPDEELYYFSSRFDHSSMIGAIHRTVRNTAEAGPADGGSSNTTTTSHVLYQDGMWRQPHNSNWPESGIGLAAEFGVGDDGDLCPFRCGWDGAEDLTNGVLGYREAELGAPFLKIGVGKLIKGSCPDCDSTEDYKFNSPYQFAELPSWTMTRSNTHTVQLNHEAHLSGHGYGLQKEISLVGNTLSITTTLTNLGRDAFSTVWYSHNFFTCDSRVVGPGYSVDLNLKGLANEPAYLEPGTWSWSTPLQEYAQVERKDDEITIEIVRALDPGVRIKSEFVKDETTNGGFTLHGCQTKIQSSIPQTESGGIPMYAYNLYVERGTLSPEPQILLLMDPGQSQTWTQKLVISPDSSTGGASLSSYLRASLVLTSDEGSTSLLFLRHPLLLNVVALTLLALTFQRIVRRRRRQQSYTQIEEVS
jgi:hypothetical protein